MGKQISLKHSLVETPSDVEAQMRCFVYLLLVAIFTYAWFKTVPATTEMLSCDEFACKTSRVNSSILSSIFVWSLWHSSSSGTWALWMHVLEGDKCQLTLWRKGVRLKSAFFTPERKNGYFMGSNLYASRAPCLYAHTSCAQVTLFGRRKEN